MGLPELSYEKVWTSAEDFPTYEGNEEQVRLDNQYHPDAIKAYLNEKLLPALQGSGEDLGASCIGMFPVEALGNATNIQEAIEALIELVTSVSQGAVPDGSITGKKLAEAAVTGENLAAAAVTADKIQDGAVTAEKLADGTLTESKFSARCIPSTALQDGLVSSAKLASGAVSTAKIASNAVSTAKLQDGAVAASKLGADVSVSNLLKNSELVLSEYQLCDELPPPGIKNRVMFKKV